MLSNIPEVRSKAMKAAQGFIGTDQPLEILGWGVSGFVFLSPDLRTAIKVHHRDEGYATEVKAYSILKQHKVFTLLGVTIPQMQHYDASRRLIQMDTVSPPFLVDFAGVKFADPNFSDDVTSEISNRIDEQFGEKAQMVYAIQYELCNVGIYYLYFRPSNLNLDGLQGS